MSRHHPGARKELIVGPVLDQESTPPHRGQIRPVQQRPQPGYVEQPGMRVQLVRHQGCEGGRHATDHARRHPVIQRREQQAAATAARETECSQLRGISPLRGCQYLERHQVVVQHGTGEGLTQHTGGLGQGVFMQCRGVIKPFVFGGTDALLLPQRSLSSHQRCQPRGRTREVEPPAPHENAS
jgi:hypothetical protein